MKKYDTFIGLDVHARSISACALNPLTGEVTEGRFGAEAGPSPNGPSRSTAPCASTSRARPAGISPASSGPWASTASSAPPPRC